MKIAKTTPQKWTKTKLRKKRQITNNPNWDAGAEFDSIMSSPEQSNEKNSLCLITWQPTFDVAYVRRLENDRAGLGSRNVAHNAMVAQLQFEITNTQLMCRHLEGKLSTLDGLGKTSQGPSNGNHDKPTSATTIMKDEKVNAIANLEAQNTSLGDVINGVKRTWDGLKKVNSLVNIKVDGLNNEIEQLQERQKEYKEIVSKLQVENDKFILRNRTMQTRLEELEPRLLKEDVIFSLVSVVKTVRTRHAGRGLSINEAKNMERNAVDNEKNTRGKNKGLDGGKRSVNSVVVETIEIGDGSDDNQTQADKSLIRNTNIYKLKISRYLPKDLKYRIESLWEKTSAHASVWDNGPKTITRNDIYTLLTEGPVTTKVYNRLLRDDSDLCPNQCWKGNHVSELTNNTNTGVRAKGEDVRDTDECIWYHLNPYNPRRSGPNVCYEDARKVHETLEGFFAEIKENGEQMLENGTIKTLSVRHGKESSYNVLDAATIIWREPREAIQAKYDIGDERTYCRGVCNRQEQIGPKNLTRPSLNPYM
ncbi:hypothetical protein LguiB_036414 [Lonicera macranthoides]